MVIAITVSSYSLFTIKTSDWRTKIRRDMNHADTIANSKAVDALLNFETVKYFGNESAETRRFDQSMARYEAAATKSWTSLLAEFWAGANFFLYVGLHDFIGTRRSKWYTNRRRFCYGACVFDAACPAT